MNSFEYILAKQVSWAQNQGIVTKSDGIKFHALSYQDLIVKLSKEYRTEHPVYIRYVCERYL